MASAYMKGENGIYKICCNRPNVTSQYFADINPQQDKTYFQGRAFNGPLIRVWPETFGVIVARPSNLVAHVVSDTRIYLNWVDNSQCEINYCIERRAIGEPFAEISKAGPNMTGFIDITPEKGVPYYYRVRALEHMGAILLFPGSQCSYQTIIASEVPKLTIPVGLFNLPPTAPITDIGVSSVTCCICWEDNSPLKAGSGLNERLKEELVVIADNLQQILPYTWTKRSRRYCILLRYLPLTLLENLITLMRK